MIKSKLKSLILDIYDLPLGKESSDFLQNLMLVLDDKSPFKKRIYSLIDGFCMCLQDLCDGYRDKNIDRGAFCEECAKLAFKMSDNILLLAVEMLSKTELNRIKDMEKRVHSFKVTRGRRLHMKTVKEGQLSERKRMKAIYDSLPDEDKAKTSLAIYSMTKKYKEMYKVDCSRTDKTCQRWIREWKNGS